jgi:cation diffusion facilitator CzcD-associated flavoprotein CzcO
VISTTTQYMRWPWVITAVRKAINRHHERVVEDPELRRKLTPTYEYGCKRPSFSNEYLQTLQMDHVEVVTDRIERFVPHGVRTVDGVVREVDVVVLATGFIGAYDPRLYRMRPVKGRDGFDLAEHWERYRLSAYEGVMHPKLPNYFHVFAPYSGRSNFFALVENASDFIIRLTREADRRGATAVDVREDAHDEYHTRMLRRMKSSIWYNRPCEQSRTYYYAEHGDVLLLRPTRGREARRTSRTFPFEHLRFDPPPAPVADHDRELESAA